MNNKKYTELVKNYINDKGWGSAHYKVCKEIRRLNNINKTLYDKALNNEIDYCDDYEPICEELYTKKAFLERIKKYFHQKSQEKEFENKYNTEYFFENLKQEDAKIIFRALTR